MEMLALILTWIFFFCCGLQDDAHGWLQQAPGRSHDPQFQCSSLIYMCEEEPIEVSSETPNPDDFSWPSDAYTEASKSLGHHRINLQDKPCRQTSTTTRRGTMARPIRVTLAWVARVCMFV